ncbi:MAG: sodium-dependent transporter [Nitrospirae bacterium]|nr:MAG: sodium-dependent transporter [Nitrospirota bacterium]
MAANGRDHWSSRLGFILAAAGSAVGLGNVWKFPYITGVYGGGAFVLVYLAAVAAVGIPILVAEVLIGRRARKDPVGAMREVGGGPWAGVGWLGVAAGFVILSYYSVVAGWTLAYGVKAAAGTFTGCSAGDIGAQFDAFLGDPVRQLFWHACFMVLVVAIVVGGVARGLERWNKVLMPALLAILMALLLVALRSPGAAEGVHFMFHTDFHKLTGKACLEALGHSFFTLSLGMGAMLTYGSYLSTKTDLLRASLVIGVLDTVVALAAGLVIFPVCFTFGLKPAAGPGLIFKTLPVAFAQMAGGRLFAFAFFLLLAFAALSSAISLLEVVVAYFVDERGWSRPRATTTMGFAIFLLGVPSALSFSTLADLHLYPGMTIFDSFDTLATNYMLPLGGLGVALVAGWRLPRQAAAEEFRHPRFFDYWHATIRYVAPLAVVAILLFKMGLLGG